MAGIYIFITVLVIIVLFLTEKINISIIKDDSFKIVVNFIFLAISFERRRKDAEKSDGKKGFRIYRKILSAVSELVAISEIEIKSICLPTVTGKHRALELPGLYGYHSLISAVIAYICTKAQKLTIHDNAVISVSDNEEKLTFYITARVMLLRVLIIFAPLLLDLLKHRKRKKEPQNVGN